MQTEWHNYKSARTGKIKGSYGYAPEHSDENLVHVYESSGFYAAYYHVKALHALSGPLVGVTTLAAAKTAAMRPILAHIKGQGDLRLHAYV